MAKKIFRITESDLHRIIHKTVKLIHENIEESQLYLQNICNKLNQMSNMTKGVNALKDGLPERRYNYRPDFSDCDIYILYDIIDSDGNKDNDGANVTDYDAYDEVTEEYTCDKNAANEFLTQQLNDLKLGIKYAKAHSQMVIPSSAQKKLDKLNAEINAAIQEWGDESILMEDGDEAGFTAKNFRFVIDNGQAHLIYDTEDGTDEAYADYGPWFYEMIDTYEFNDEELRNTIKWYKSCLKRGIRYMKEYNPEWDDDEAARERFFNNDNN